MCYIGGERLALLSDMLPPGIFQPWVGITLARTVMAAAGLDLFEGLAAGPLTAEEVARRWGTHPRASEKPLNAPVGVGCRMSGRDDTACAGRSAPG